ncbi:hypothetical protein [Pandoraea sp.]|uniref:hypothetical protein n=1 Tax=Pandoraea sp. TaxID=1883445 RepID=UPI0025FAEA27|nr:hypothetical protein [Pandoraea sp.]
MSTDDLPVRRKLDTDFGARRPRSISARRVPGDRLKQMFGALIVVVTAYKVATLVL